MADTAGRLEAEVRPTSSDLLALTKPGITKMVALTAWVGFVLASSRLFVDARLIGLLVGTVLQASGASVLNQYLEVVRDTRMPRTASRPIPMGRVSRRTALGFGVLLCLLGTAALWQLTNALATGIGVATILLYLFVYTPLKVVTPWSTVIGAVPGALPPLMGWVAAEGRVSAAGWLLFGVLFFWQLPHFFAIAWLYREDYAKGGYRTNSVVDPTGRRAGWETLIFTVALVATSLGFLLTPLGVGLAYVLVASALGAVFLGLGLQFSRRLDKSSARRLLLFSIAYLPLLLGTLVVDALV